MKSKLLTIGQAANMLGVSIQTLRRWDEAGKLSSIRRKKSGNRYYKERVIDDFIKNNTKDLFRLARKWTVNKSVVDEIPSLFYCKDISIFQARLSKLETELGRVKRIKEIYPLITAIVGEIGNNSFDHNLGRWPDVPGIFFAYDLNGEKIVLADRGQGVLETLKKVRPELLGHQKALDVAFNEVVSGRAPEYRGNGLKFVRNVVADNDIILIFQTGDGELKIDKSKTNLNIKKSNTYIQGCLALIKF